ncbi:acyltransferase [Empedobacter sedimenti]|uniref:acyltransferase n=1 Tax=Empedobacter sedimenti TaxID=3042610 RepID=UPI0024A6878B|nr:acyltransferase [Empedobacter sedimenti]
MYNFIAHLIYKIQLKLNKIRFLSNSNISFDKSLRLGNFTTFIIHPSSKGIIKENVEIRNNFNFVLGKNATISIGNKVFLNNYCSINCLESIDIGENTLFGENVKLYDHNHKYRNDQVFHQDFTTGPISIGKNCWLGSNVVVLKGVTIGDNVIIGAGCVIHKDIPSNSIIINKQEQILKSI